MNQSKLEKIACKVIAYEHDIQRGIDLTNKQNEIEKLMSNLTANEVFLLESIINSKLEHSKIF